MAIFTMFAGTEIRNRYKKEDVSNYQLVKETIKEYFKEMYLDVPESVLHLLSGNWKDFNKMKPPTADKNSLLRE